MNQITPWTLDFETFYTDKDHGAYSLSYMTAEEYIRHPWFEIIGFSLKPGNGEARWFSGDLTYCKQVLHHYINQNVLCIGHNMSEFDSLILAEVIGARPGAYACTLQMARSLHGSKTADGKNLSNSLATLCRMYGLPDKGDAVVRAINKRRADFNPRELAEYGEYCNNDAARCWDLFNLFSAKMPPNELWVANLCTRMFAEPRLHLDAPLLRQMQEDMAVRKSGLLARVADILKVDPNLPYDTRMGQTQSLLRKDAVLAGVLKNQYDLDPPMKPSPKRRNPDGTPLMVYAFAKTDEGMEALVDFEDESDPQGAEDIQALASARLGVKSTLAESRVGRFIGIAERGALPVPLAFGKTHTNRLAGSQKINMQNLGGTKPVNEKTLPGTLVRTPRGMERMYKYNKDTKQIMCVDGMIFDVDDPISRERQVWVAGLRDAIIAPPGKKIVVIDSSQIELRVCHLLAGQMDTVEELRRGVDVYSSFASSVYHRPITKHDKKERQHGKVGMLQLQYQAGGKSFKNAARVMGGVRLTEDEAHATVQVYRSRFSEVTKFWRTCQQAIQQMARGGGRYIDQWGLCAVEHNRITMPGRVPLAYHNLRQEMVSFNGEDPELQWVYDDKEKRHTKKIYGGSVTENLCQWIAGNVVKDQTLEIERKWGTYTPGGTGVIHLPPRLRDNGVALMVHDEAVVVVDENDADECLRFSLGAMSQAPSWWPMLPVAAEGGIGDRYSEAK